AGSRSPARRGRHGGLGVQRRSWQPARFIAGTSRSLLPLPRSTPSVVCACSPARAGFRFRPRRPPSLAGPGMKRWNEFAAESPAVAENGRALIYQFRVGLGYLATIRKDGGPRVHPVCPVIANGGLYVFIGNQSPKLHDLLRDGRFALHSF